MKSWVEGKILALVGGEDMGICFSEGGWGMSTSSGQVSVAVACSIINRLSSR